LRQPPSNGERNVALISEPSRKPNAMPADTTPFAIPSRFPENQTPHVLCTFIGAAIGNRPATSTVAVRLA